MSPEPLDLTKIFRETENWPQCPICGQNKILMGGHLAGCAKCLFLGESSLIKPTPVSKLVRAKISNRSFAERAVVLLQHGEIDEETAKAIYQKSSEISQRMTHYPYFIQSRKRLEYIPFFPPTLITEHGEPEVGNMEIRTIENREELDGLRPLIQRQNVASLIYESDDNLNILYSPKEDARVLMMETHLYNAPTNCQAIMFNRSTKRGWNFQAVPLAKTKQCRRSSLVWQPICWDVIPFDRDIQPVWLAAFEVQGKINVTYCVAENLNNGPEVMVSIRKPWYCGAPKLRRLEYSTAEEAVAALQRHRTELLASKGEAIFNIEMQWDLSVNPNTIMYDIRQNSLWSVYAREKQ